MIGEVVGEALFSRAWWAGARERREVVKCLVRDCRREHFHERVGDTRLYHDVPEFVG